MRQQSFEFDTRLNVDIDPNYEKVKGNFGLDEIKLLLDFAVVPPDYLSLFLILGKANFYNDDLGINFTLRDPVEAHEFYFDDERVLGFPNVFPMTSSSGGETLYYGAANDVTGVFVTGDGASMVQLARYVAPTLTDIVFHGHGLDIISHKQ